MQDDPTNFRLMKADGNHSFFSPINMLGCFIFMYSSQEILEPIISRFLSLYCITLELMYTMNQ